MNSRDMTPYRATPLGSTYSFFVVARSEDEAVRMVRFSVPCIATVRKVKEGEITADLYGFLTTDPDAVVGPVHPKAMPVILTTPEEAESWTTAPWAEASALHRPLPDDVLRIVATGERQDGTPTSS